MDFNILFTIDKKPIPDNVKDKLSEYGCSWVVLNIRNNRVLIDATIPNKEVAQTLKNYFITQNFNPKLVRLTKFDGLDEGVVKDENGNPTGTPELPVDSTEYLDTMPDEITYNPDGTVASTQRPSSPYEFHSFMGWSERIF